MNPFRQIRDPLVRDELKDTSVRDESGSLGVAKLESPRSLEVEIG